MRKTLSLLGLAVWALCLIAYTPQQIQAKQVKAWNATEGSTASTLGNQLQGDDGTNAKNIACDSSGNLNVTLSGNNPSVKQTPVTSDTLITSASGTLLWGFTHKATTNVSSVAIEDSTTQSASLAIWDTAIASGYSHTVMFPHPVAITNGIYVDVTNGATVSVIYE